MWTVRGRVPIRKDQKIDWVGLLSATLLAAGLPCYCTIKAASVSTSRPFAVIGGKDDRNSLHCLGVVFGECPKGFQAVWERKAYAPILSYLSAL